MCEDLVLDGFLAALSFQQRLLRGSGRFAVAPEAWLKVHIIAYKPDCRPQSSYGGLGDALPKLRVSNL